MTINFAVSDPFSPPRIVAAGRSVDHLVRVNGKWLVQLRDVSPEE
jgi:hypothetical protein